MCCITLATTAPASALGRPRRRLHLFDLFDPRRTDLYCSTRVVLMPPCVALMSIPTSFMQIRVGRRHSGPFEAPWRGNPAVSPRHGGKPRWADAGRCRFGYGHEGDSPISMTRRRRRQCRTDQKRRPSDLRFAVLWPHRTTQVTADTGRQAPRLATRRDATRREMIFTWLITTEQVSLLACCRERDSVVTQRQLTVCDTFRARDEPGDGTALPRRAPMPNKQPN